jgi:hypothetical protein
MEDVWLHHATSEHVGSRENLHIHEEFRWTDSEVDFPEDVNVVDMGKHE